MHFDYEERIGLWDVQVCTVLLGSKEKGKKNGKQRMLLSLLLLLQLLLMMLSLEHFDLLSFCMFMDLVIGWVYKHNKDLALVK